MKSRILFGLFVAVALAQLSLPASMIWRSERALIGGQEFRFRTAPVDPYDAFRGRYVALRFDQNQAPVAAGRKIETGQKVYALIEVGPDGFARFSSVTDERPPDQSYLRVAVSSVQGTTAHLELPFDRFYMEETMAPAAEQAYRQHSRRGQQDAYVVVRVQDGRGVIANLYVDGRPIAEFLRAQKP